MSSVSDTRAYKAASNSPELEQYRRPWNIGVPGIRQSAFFESCREEHSNEFLWPDEPSREISGNKRSLVGRIYRSKTRLEPPYSDSQELQGVSRPTYRLSSTFRTVNEGHFRLGD